MTVLLTILGVGIAAAAAVGWVISVADSAPPFSSLKPRAQGQVSEVFGADGSLLGYIASNVLRTIVPQNQMPQALKDATVAIEDRRFYQHGGVDYQGIIRAGFRDLFHPGSGIQGGSTLTMQLISNVYLPYKLREHHNIRYKIIQATEANRLESRHTKSWILLQYNNDVDYGTVGGQSAYGVGAASHMFFDKPVQQLDLAQVALLAGLPQAPSQFNPFNAPDLARNRRNQVLQAMVASHYITQAQADVAKASPLQVKQNSTYQYRSQPFIFDYVKQELVQRLGQKLVDQGGLRVYATIDPKRQAEARAALLAHEGGVGNPAAALVSINPANGDIQAMATTSNYGSGPGQTIFNYAWQGHRQTGSAFKVFALMTLIHHYDGDPNQTFYTSRHLTPGWLPGYPTYEVQTAELSYQGTISITKATTVSDNTVFAQLAQDLGMPNVTATAHAMGITSPLTDYPSEVLGAVAVSPLEMADAYATIASGGIHHEPTAISRVVLPNGKVINLGSPPGNRVFSQGEAYAADQVLKTVITSGTGTAAGYGCPAAGKTGTTTNFTDAYFDGFTPQLATAVWVGYPNATTSMPGGFGGTLAAPIWHDYMQQASNGFCGDFPAPAVAWQGQPYFGHFASTGHAAVGATGTGTGTSTTGTSTSLPKTATTKTTATTGGATTPGGSGTTTGATTTGMVTSPSGGGSSTRASGGAAPGTPPPGFGNGG
ncbi:MAG: transglycosylase domain-containing protein [Solirubrobacteraceae bacterium]